MDDDELALHRLADDGCPECPRDDDEVTTSND